MTNRVLQPASGKEMAAFDGWAPNRKQQCRNRLFEAVATNDGTTKVHCIAIHLLMPYTWEVEVFVSEDFIRLDAQCSLSCSFFLVLPLFYPARWIFSLRLSRFLFADCTCIRSRIPHIVVDSGDDGGVSIAGDTQVSRTQRNEAKKTQRENIKLFVCARV